MSTEVEPSGAAMNAQKLTSEDTAEVKVFVRFTTLREDVRKILKANHVAIQHMTDIEDVYRLIDFCWLRANGLPWLDRDVYAKLQRLMHQLSSVERIARFVWTDAQNCREDADLCLPSQLQGQRRRKARAHRRMFARGGERHE
jgi:hypothetical protein